MVSFRENRTTRKLNAQENYGVSTAKEKTVYLSEPVQPFSYLEMQAKEVRMSKQRSETCLSQQETQTRPS